MAARPNQEPVPRILHESDIGPELDAAIRKGLCACFPADADTFSKTRAWHGSAPAWTVVVQEGDTVIAHAGFVDRTVLVGKESLRVAGVQNVFVLPDRRGSGLAGRIMCAIMEKAAELGFDCGLLFCIPRLEHLYARCGWHTLPPAPVTRIDVTGRELPLPGKNIAMYHPLARRDFPAGPIHLRGNDW